MPSLEMHEFVSTGGVNVGTVLGEDDEGNLVVDAREELQEALAHGDPGGRFVVTSTFVLFIGIGWQGSSQKSSGCPGNWFWKSPCEPDGRRIPRGREDPRITPGVNRAVLQVRSKDVKQLCTVGVASAKGVASRGASDAPVFAT
ncbi:hypothetical protein [Actinopolyspora saharensis]|uniref:hypothetical protein n=2 Tax=Actinopolyspora TaxID=1849 RepID=UPI00111338F5|nr:hypothetical protein [Actinopolyspora saharensis]